MIYLSGMWRSFRALVALIALSLATPAMAKSQPLTIFAAASLTDAMNVAGKAFTAKTRVPVRFSFAASGVLARQLEAGAKADLFISADNEWMDYAQGRGLVQPTSRANLLGGRLALIAPADSRIDLPIRSGFPIAQALGKGRLATGDPDYVPVGRYARAALMSLGIWGSVADRLARTESVRFALALVSRKEVPLGIVYETDAIIDKRVRILGIFPANSHPAIVYPMALTRKAGPDGSRFAAFLKSPEGLAIFRRFGFKTF